MIALGRLEVETADHVVLRYDLAGGGNRGFAALVDVVAATGVLIGVAAARAVLAAVLPSGTLFALNGVFVMLALLLAWAYFIVFEWLWGGRTLGKRIFGLRVIGADGSPATFTAVLVRNLVRVVDFLPAFYGIGLLAIVVSGRSQRLGDLAAGTFVVRAPRPRIDLPALRTVASTAAAGRAVPVRGLPGELQRLVREFVARERGLDAAQRARVAAAVAAALRPRVADAPADDLDLIHAVARSLRSSGGDGERLPPP